MNDVRYGDKVSAALVIPETSCLAPNEGVIVAVWRCRGSFKVGDRVMFAQDTDVSIKVDGVRYILVRERDLVGVIDPK